MPGTLEVNVLRMVGRCLVCSRLISTWVSSLEPPPSTPSTVLHLHTHARTHSHTHTIHQNRQSSSSTTERIQRHRHQEACVLLHRSKFMSVSYVSPSRLLFPPPFADPPLSRTLRRSVSSILPLTRRFTHGSLARPTREQPCSSPLNSRDLDAACPSRSRRLFTPFPDHAPFHLFLRYSRRTGTTLLVVNVLVLFHPPRSGLKSRASSFEFLLTIGSSIYG